MMHGEYRTPKRRHSSLFQRMQEEIQKISRKLSQAKGKTRQSSYENTKSLYKDGKKNIRQRQSQEKQRVKENIASYKQKRKNIHFDQLPQPSAVETVRFQRKHENETDLSPYSLKKTMCSKTLNRRLNFATVKQDHQQKILQLEQQNSTLTEQIKKLEEVCIDQSQRLGYASAYFQDKCKKLEQEKEDYLKQSIYLKKLCEHYKSKSKKYKEHLRKYSNKKVSEQSYYMDG